MLKQRCDCNIHKKKHYKCNSQDCGCRWFIPLKSKIEFVAVPVIADNPRYGWHIVSKTQWSSEKKANEAIRRLTK